MESLEVAILSTKSETMEKRNKIIYYGATGLLSALMLFSAGMYLFNYDEVKGVFGSLGFPSWIIYPLAIAKILGLVAIWSRKSDTLREWAYAGFFFDFFLAAGAHLSVGDGEHMPAIMAAIFLLVSYIYDKKVFD